MTVKTSVVYLQKDKFQLYLPTIGRVIEFRFTPEMIRDLDVISDELLEDTIKVFVTNSKIAPSNLVFVLSENAYFTKDFVQPVQQKGTMVQPEITSELLQKQANEFIEHVPFDNVVSKTIPIKDGIKVVATNKDFYESIAIAFEHLGFTIESVLPGVVLGNGLSLRPVMDPMMANIILQKVSTVRQYNLLNQQAYQSLAQQESGEVDEVELERQQSKKTSKQSIYALIGILPILLILIVIIYMQFQQSSQKPKSNITNGPPPVHVTQPVLSITVSPTVTVPTSSTSSNLQTQNLTVQVVNTSSSSSTAQQLLARLGTYKFKSVSLQTDSSVSSGSTLVSFSPSVSQDVRDVVLSEVKKLKTNIIVQEKQLGTYDISIVLGQ